MRLLTFQFSVIKQFCLASFSHKTFNFYFDAVVRKKTEIVCRITSTSSFHFFSNQNDASNLCSCWILITTASYKWTLHNNVPSAWALLGRRAAGELIKMHLAIQMDNWCRINCLTAYEPHVERQGNTASTATSFWTAIHLKGRRLCGLEAGWYSQIIESEIVSGTNAREIVTKTNQS